MTKTITFPITTGGGNSLIKAIMTKGLMDKTKVLIAFRRLEILEQEKEKLTRFLGFEPGLITPNSINTNPNVVLALESTVRKGLEHYLSFIMDFGVIITEDHQDVIIKINICDKNI